MRIPRRWPVPAVTLGTVMAIMGDTQNVRAACLAVSDRLAESLRDDDLDIARTVTAKAFRRQLERWSTHDHDK